MNMKQKIRVDLTSEQDGEQITQQYRGEWFLKDRSFYIRYLEQTEQGEIRHLLRYRQNELFVSRKGSVESEQTYSLGDARVGYYDNKIVRFDLHTKTTLLQVLDYNQKIMEAIPQEPHFHLKWEYELFMGEQTLGRFSIRLYIQEEK